MKALLTSLVHAGQDIFGRGFKFLWFYKRGGHRVILNKKGDLIVRPSPLEASLRLQPFSQSLKAHLLSSYLRSIAAAVMREYSHGSTSDRSSLLELIDRNKLLKVCLCLDTEGLPCLVPMPKHKCVQPTKSKACPAGTWMDFAHPMMGVHSRHRIKTITIILPCHVSTVSIAQVYSNLQLDRSCHCVVKRPSYRTQSHA